MLELIVLGQIPGTQFQITFLQVAAFAATLVLGLISAHELNLLLKRSHNSHAKIEEKAL